MSDPVFQATADAPPAVAPPATEQPPPRSAEVGLEGAQDMIRVVIVDDHPIARRGARQVLTEGGRMHVISCVESGQQLTSVLDGLAAASQPDVILLDLYLGDDEPCLPVVGELSTTGRRVLVMSASGRRQDVVGAVRAGARGYITKQASPEMFIAAIETVAAGGFALSASLADLLHSELGRGGVGTDAGPATPHLSAREEEALSLIARGFTHAQTATRMGVSKATVNTYVERIRSKLQVGNKAELTRAALMRNPPADAWSPPTGQS